MGTISSTNGKIVVLLSDFGCRDGYAGIMKGVILSLDRGIRIVDLTHEIDPHNILSGAYVLSIAWNYFPRGSVFCAVVDPGVGSRRGTVFAQLNERYLIAPDNGLISLLARMIPDGRVYALKLDTILELAKQDPSMSSRLGEGGRPPSSTFHGRDLFAPAAALCAAGFAEKIRGQAIEPVVLPEAIPQHHHNSVTGAILHIDRFGNCISSVHSTDLAVIRSQHDGPADVECGEFRGKRICRTYADVAIGSPLCLIGSSGFLEIAVREDSAAERFGIIRGQPLSVTAVEPW
jgi:S-adenosylmethionine hydrolase